MADTERRRIPLAEAERIAEARILVALRRDARYKNSPDIEAQQAREEEIDLGVWDDIEREYFIEDSAA